MNISRSLLYLLLLYAVLDKDNKKLSLTTGLTIAFVIMLVNCYFNRLYNGNNNNGCGCNGTNNTFFGLNGI